jgi:nucleoside 2-deoxyribosyltransferase
MTILSSSPQDSASVIENAPDVGNRNARKNMTVSVSLTVSICGSYHRHLRKMRALILECRKLGIRVRIPKYAVKKYSTHGFVYLKGERGTPKDLQEKNFRAIERSSFVLVVNPKGYIGPSTSMEIGFAISKGVPIFCTDVPDDYIFRFYTKHVRSLREIRDMMVSSRS